MRHHLILALGACTLIPVGVAQTTTSTSYTTNTVIPTNTQNTTTSVYTPGVTYQSTNPNYPVRNPFYFEGRIDWDLLKISEPSNTWEFAQRGIHEQDDLEDNAAAIADYQKSISMNSLQNGTCQLVTTKNWATGSGLKIDPPPCMFTVRLRLANLLMTSDPKTALQLFNEVLEIDPLRLGVNGMIGQTYALLGDGASNAGDKEEFYNDAVNAYRAEIALSPVTELSTKLSGDEANNAHVHWALAGLYAKLGETKNEITELDLYLKATKWHSDTYPWRIQIAEGRMRKLTTASKHDR